MAVFTQVSDIQVAELLALYGLPKPDAVTGIAEGTENSNYKVMAGGVRYILTLFEGRTALQDLPYFLGLMEHVARKGLPAAAPVRTLNGDRLTAIAGKPAALIEFLPGRPNMAPDHEDAFRAGECLARFHSAASDFVPTRPNSMSLASWKQMAREAGDGLERFGEGVTEEVAALLHDLKNQWPGELKRGTIHGDLFPDNLLLDHSEPAGLIDFYFACTDFLAYDLAIAMNAYMPEEGPVDITNAEAVFNGYQNVRPLTEFELQALPLFLCGSALRFFLSRAVDNIFEQESALYSAKDPLPWLRLMRHHRASLESGR